MSKPLNIVVTYFKNDQAHQDFSREAEAALAEHLNQDPYEVRADIETGFKPFSPEADATLARHLKAKSTT